MKPVSFVSADCIMSISSLPAAALTDILRLGFYEATAGVGFWRASRFEPISSSIPLFQNLHGAHVSGSSERGRKNLIVTDVQASVCAVHMRYKSTVLGLETLKMGLSIYSQSSLSARVRFPEILTDSEFADNALLIL